MALTTAEARGHIGARADAGAATGSPVSLAIALALGLGLALTWPRVIAVWETGAFFDTDDAMRMVQVRDLMAGQGWFDMIAHRLDPPHGLFMHWSRVVDVPLVGLISAFRLVTAPETAERLARLVFPLALQAGLYAGLAWCGGTLIGARGRVPAVALGFLSGAMFGQYQPGRIDHHAPQITLLVFTVGASLAALDRSRAPFAALAGALTALSLAISIENTPFFVVLYAAFGLAFIAYGPALRAMLLWLAGGLAAGLLAFFAATVSPSRYLIGSCDAFSAMHLVAGLTGAAAFSVLAIGLPLWRTLPARAVATVFAGGFVLLAVGMTYPACLGDPLAQVDPFVKDVWLSTVSEALPLTKLMEMRPQMLPVLVLPIVLGLVAALWAVRHTHGLARTRWMLTAALIGVALIAAFWQVRVFTSAAPLAALASVYAILAIADRLVARATGVVRAFVLFLLSLPFSPMAYAAIVPMSGPSNKGTLACLAPTALQPLAALPPGLVLAPLDSGSHLLYYTGHSVIAAPYHRNSRGNRIAIEALLASPDDAERIVRASGARYVMLCPSMRQVDLLIPRAPHGLAALLAEGGHPNWLEPVPLAGTPYRVFTLRPPAPAPPSE